jgi:hypothetical protein
MALITPPRGYFLHGMGTLRAEFACALSERLVNLNIKYLAEREKELFQEDEIRADGEQGNEKEFGIRTFIPPSLTDSDEYWHHVASRCFGISTQLGAPTFFLTFTMNRYWPEYQALRRADGNFADSAVMALVFRPFSTP